MGYWNHLSLKETSFGAVVFDHRTRSSYELCALSFQLLQLLKEKDRETEVVSEAAMFNVSPIELQEKLNELKTIFDFAPSAVASPPFSRWVREEGLTGIQWGFKLEKWPINFSFLFNREVVFIAALFSIVALVSIRSLVDFNGFFRGSFTFWIVLLLGLSTVFHEWGHIQASKKFGIQRGSIGFGFYYVFPVLFTDLTETYLLGRSKRLVVGLSGIYFEWIYGTLLFGVAIVFNSSIIAQVGLLVLIKSGYNLNPFFRTDGYWVLSDYLGIHHLKERAYQSLKLLFSRKSHQKPGDRVLQVYACAHASFYLLFVVFLAHRICIHLIEFLVKGALVFQWSSLQSGMVLFVEFFAFFHLARLLLQAIYRR